MIRQNVHLYFIIVNFYVQRKINIFTRWTRLKQMLYGWGMKSPLSSWIMNYVQQFSVESDAKQNSSKSDNIQSIGNFGIETMSQWLCINKEYTIFYSNR